MFQSPAGSTDESFFGFQGKGKNRVVQHRTAAGIELHGLAEEEPIRTPWLHDVPLRADRGTIVPSRFFFLNTDILNKGER